MEFDKLLELADKTYKENFDCKVWFGRCIFLSWYCDVGTCKFCYRATQKSRIIHAENARRSLASVIVEAILAKKLGWRIEFLTGGYKIYPNYEILQIVKTVSEVYGSKIWLNLGVISKEDIEKFRPYVKGIVSSIETINPKLHDIVCPDKKIQPYEEMFSYCDGFYKSITIVIGLGETKDDFPRLEQFIRKHNLSRLTFYALKPIKGSIYTKGPGTKDYVWWIAKTRIAFPKLEIIAGTTYKRVCETESVDTKNEVYLLIKAGANAITKFPATKKFNTKAAQKIEDEIIKAGRMFVSTLTKMPDIMWDNEIDIIDIDSRLKEDMQKVMRNYVKRMQLPSDDDELN